MKKLLLYLAILSICLSCGVKKPAAQQGQQEPQTTTEPVVINDSLSFLGDLINDSTIHINYVYGIPFIIDDSVPMLLPPIDKNPEGYVSNDAYRTSANPPIIYGKNTLGDQVVVCGIANPMDSLLWLNKCIYDLKEFCSEENKGLYPSHEYTYVITALTIHDNSLIAISVLQKYSWLYWNKDYPKRLQSSIIYFYDCEGDLQGKMHMEMPVQIEHPNPNAEPKHLRASIPNYHKFDQIYLSKAYRKSAGLIALKVIFQGTMYSVGD